MSDYSQIVYGDRRGKSQMLAVRRDAALKQGHTVAVASIVNGKAHLCIVKPFRRATPKGNTR